MVTFWFWLSGDDRFSSSLVTSSRCFFDFLVILKIESLCRYFFFSFWFSMQSQTVATARMTKRTAMMTVAVELACSVVATSERSWQLK